MTRAAALLIAAAGLALGACAPRMDDQKNEGVAPSAATGTVDDRRDPAASPAIITAPPQPDGDDSVARNPPPTLPPPPLPPSAPMVVNSAADDEPMCPGIRIRRPKGSNCLGILPTACGADKLAALIGKPDTPEMRADTAQRIGHVNIRWIKPGQPVIENLDPERLNVGLDGQGRVAKVDCY